jgi:hypothetical protein
MKRPFTVLVFALCIHACAALAGDPPALKATVGRPVLPELMGGCSMKCAFPWTVEAIASNATKPAKVSLLNDERPSPPWTDPRGIGAKITFSFPKKIPAEMEGQVPFYGLDVINGDWNTEDSWKASARVKKARLYYNGKPLYDVIFPDTRRWLHLSFDDIMVHSGDRMTLEILEIYPGKNRGSAVAISEIVLQGAH